MTTTPGITPTERYLNGLARRSFLRLWSYPGLYRDQGTGVRGGEGAELCDLLVVFENHALIFSDKDCEFPDHPDRDVAWGRWYRKAVAASARQVWGAERWLRSHPDRVFLDRACTTPLPIAVPRGPDLQVHRIVVAHDTSGRRARLTGGSGTLMINPALVGDQHLRAAAEGGHPFAVGTVDPGRGFVHVLDEGSLGVVLETLDTITDFVNYLARKERFLGSGRLHGAFGEEDLLAYYLKHVGDGDADHDFVLPPGSERVLLEEGHWKDYCGRPEVARKREADRESYMWDALIEEVAGHALAGSTLAPAGTTLADHEGALRSLAREPRIRRRILGRGLLDRVLDPPPPGAMSFRSALPSFPGDPHYVFVVSCPDAGVVPGTPAWDEYREARRAAVHQYAMAAMDRFDDASTVVGVGTEGAAGDGALFPRSFDLVTVARRDWTADDAELARELRARWGWFKDVRWSRGHEDEYPSGPPTIGWVFERPAAATGRTTGRTMACPCGSGRKYKRCCYRADRRSGRA